jgi:hypothetical protein
MSLCARAAWIVVGCLAWTSSVSASSWSEVGDAGGKNDPQGPQVTVGTGPLTEIHGSLGGEDVADAFEIYCTGTGFTVSSSTSAPLLLTAWDARSNSIGGSDPVLNPTLSVGFGPGFYSLQISSSPDRPAPPVAAYTLFLSGIGGSVTFAAPEPSLWTLLSAVALAALARRRPGSAPVSHCAAD